MEEWKKQMVDCVGSDLLRSIVQDHRATAPPPRVATVSVGTGVHRGAKGWVEPRPMAAPQGQWLTPEERKAKELATLQQKLQQLDEESIVDQKNDPIP